MTTPLFVLEEATIEQLQSALKAGRVNCAEVVQRYIDRCRRYNGVATRLVTAQGGLGGAAARNDARRSAPELSAANRCGQRVSSEP